MQPSFPFTFGKREISFPRALYVVAIHVGALAALFPQFFSWTAILCAIALHFLTGCLGLTIGLHRALAHKSVVLRKPVERLFVFLAVLEMHRPITWVALHRFHHHFSGSPLDPHNAGEGFFWSHLGWLLREAPVGFDPYRYAADISHDPFYRFLERNGLYVFLCSLLLIFAIGGYSGLVWTGFVRLVVVAHSAWAINSLCHLVGYKNFEEADGFNLRILSCFTYGEGLHNNHHGRQGMANFAVKRGEMDLGWLIIRALARARLANILSR